MKRLVRGRAGCRAIWRASGLGTRVKRSNLFIGFESRREEMCVYRGTKRNTSWCSIKAADVGTVGESSQTAVMTLTI